MTENVYSLTEIVGTSKEGVDAAIRNAIDTASQSLRNIKWFEVQEIRGFLDKDHVEYFQVTLKIGFRYEPPAES